jgi:hypothetical protein
MKALFWKDCRINGLVIVIGGVLLVGPYVGAALWQIGDAWPAWPSAPAWAGMVLWSSQVSLAFALVTLALLGGNTIACERADRSAEFLAYLPPSRASILASKAALALTVAAVIWGLNLLMDWGLAPVISRQPLWQISRLHKTNLAASGAFLFGVSWLGSSRLESPAFATSLGIASVFLVLIALAGLKVSVGWPARDEFEYWSNVVLATLGTGSFAAGTWYYLRRVEP